MYDFKSYIKPWSIAMLREHQLTSLLRAISEKELKDITYTDFVLLGDVLQKVFAPGHPLAERYKALGISNRVARGSHDFTENQAKAIESIAAGAMASIQTFGLPTAPESEQNDIAQLVNQTFYKSELFNVAKWVLAIALALVGLGSLGFAGFNIYAQDRLQEAQRRLAETTAAIDKLTTDARKKQDELQKQQDETIKNVQQLIAKYASEATKTFDAELAKMLAEQKAKADASMAAATKSVEDGATESLKTIKAASESGQRSVIQELGELSASIRSAQGDANQRVSKFNSDVDTQFAKLGTALDAELVAHKNTLQQAETAGTKQIEDDVKARLDLLAKKAELEISGLEVDSSQKKTQMDSATADILRSLAATSRSKLADIDAKATDATDQMSKISADVDAYAQRFELGLTQHVKQWDDKITAGQQHLEELDKQSGQAQARINDLSGKLTALEASAGPALVIAERLRNGTGGGDLENIGAILQRSERYVVVVFATSGLGAVFSLIALAFAYRSRT
ncbi:MAG TPA: hypothetical protein VLX44_07195 [Xanthobacteraceae bacterium]|nr:hypothetical protein [Xanthobacteraceae bacterium]